MGCCSNLQNAIAKNKRDFGAFLWNPRTKEFCGRTAGSWCEIFVFYVFFYGLLACWWGALLYTRVSFLPEIEDGPFHTDYISHRGPGMTLVPTGANMARDIEFNKNADNCCSDYVKSIQQFFKDYTTIDGIDMSADFKKCEGDGDCSDNGGSIYLDAITIELNYSEAAEEEDSPEEGGDSDDDEPEDTRLRRRVKRQESNETAEGETEEEDDDGPEKIKLFNLMNLGECYSDEDFGYNEGEPCLFFTVNNAFGWVPTELSAERKEEHEELAEMDTSAEFMPFVCQGYKDKDKAVIDEIKVFPQQGIKRDYFPWKGGENYRKPIVAAKVKLLPEGFNKKIRIECKAYADNFHPSFEKPNSGRVEVTLEIDDGSSDSQDNNEEVVAPDNNSPTK
ncbi:sodium/potassium-transporting ATPase subunit beta-1-like [Convolutriloba macropyga]|uniref:sodium/potassium-transporting ATPase subunit beta-1-like n=1 Tax=Convolutriloba macropyga TaxID=536237 RepID=UPI003F51DE27